MLPLAEDPRSALVREAFKPLQSLDPSKPYRFQRTWVVPTYLDQCWTAAYLRSPSSFGSWDCLCLVVIEVDGRELIRVTSRQLQQFCDGGKARVPSYLQIPLPPAVCLKGESAVRIIASFTADDNVDLVLEGYYDDPRETFPQMPCFFQNYELHEFPGNGLSTTATFRTSKPIKRISVAFGDALELNMFQRFRKMTLRLCSSQGHSYSVPLLAAVETPADWLFETGGSFFTQTFAPLDGLDVQQKSKRSPSTRILRPEHQLMLQIEGDIPISKVMVMLVTEDCWTPAPANATPKLELKEPVPTATPKLLPLSTNACFPPSADEITKRLRKTSPTVYFVGPAIREGQFPVMVDADHAAAPDLLATSDPALGPGYNNILYYGSSGVCLKYQK